MFLWWISIALVREHFQGIDAIVLGDPGQPGGERPVPTRHEPANTEKRVGVRLLQNVLDGQNGLPAVIRVCGPDDLLDFANPSSQLVDLGLNPPPGTDDNDQEIEACTEYTLAAADQHVRVDTEVFNNEPGDLRLLVGDWMNAAGEVDGFSRRLQVTVTVTGPPWPRPFSGRSQRLAQLPQLGSL